MVKDNKNIILINKLIPQDALPSTIISTHHQTVSLDFSNYQYIYGILEQYYYDNNILEIYDITNCSQLLHGDIIPVSDHINRIGHNPFIGKQKTFGIDFIDIANLYYPCANGVVSNSLGTAFQFTNQLPYPSTFLANVATLGHVYKYKIKAYLINIQL